MKRSSIHLVRWLAVVSFAAGARGEDFCDILYNDTIPVSLGHAKVQNGLIEWTDSSGTKTYNDPPYWVQSKIKRCGGLVTEAVPVAAPLGPEAFGIKCKSEDECSVSDTKVFSHFAQNAKKGDVVRFGETQDKVEFTFTPKNPAGFESKKKSTEKGGSNKVVVPKEKWTAAVAVKPTA
jgi:hypothetical protein